ncbi:hypothetical protein [Sphingopyxis chilensis]
MTYEVPDNSRMSPEGRFWAAYIQSWRIPVSLMTLWWDSAVLLWLPSSAGFHHHHGSHDQLTVPKSLDEQESPSLFA